jgi:hypothetical protein
MEAGVVNENYNPFQYEGKGIKVLEPEFARPNLYLACNNVQNYLLPFRVCPSVSELYPFCKNTP